MNNFNFPGKIGAILILIKTIKVKSKDFQIIKLFIILFYKN